MNFVNILPGFFTRGLMLHKMHGYRENQIIYAASALCISDYLKKGGSTLAELVELTQTDRDFLFRFIRACVSIGLYSEKGDRYFLNKAGNMLVSGSASTLRPIAMMRGDETNWKPWGELLYALKTGKNSFKKVFGTDLFDYFSKNPDSCENFNKSMSVFTSWETPAILRKYNFSVFKNIIDIGGGNGGFLMKIIQKNSYTNGIVYDIKELKKEAEAFLSTSCINGRINFISGNMFESIPEGGDCYIIKRVLHDWDDENVLKILKICRKAVKPESKLLIIEYIISKNNHLGILNDIQMMVTFPGGRERTMQEFDSLVSKAGFKISKTISVKAVTIMECTPV